MSKIRPRTQLAQDGATTGQALVWDGTKWAPASAAAVVFAEDATTAATGDFVLTLGATPIAHSVSLYKKPTGSSTVSLLWPGVDYTISGAVVTLNTTLTSGDTIYDRYATTVASPGAATLVGGPSVKQSASNTVGSGTSLTVTLASAPTNGNLLVAAFNISQFTTARDLTLPTGWTLLDTVVNTDNRLSVIYKVASGDTAAQTFNFTGTAQTHTGALLEIQTTNGAISAHAIANAASTSVTAPNANDLPLAFFVQNDGTSNSNTSAGSSISTASWTTDQKNVPSFHSLLAGHGPLTTAGATVAPTATWDGTVQNPEAAIAIVHHA